MSDEHTGPSSAEESPVVAPLDLDAVRTVQAGTAIWALVLLALLPFHGWLEDTDRVWWLWTCVVGVTLGVAGIAFTTRRRRRLRARRRDAV